MKIQTEQQLEVLFGNQLDTIDQALRGIYTDGYYRTAFEVMKGTGIGITGFSSLDTDKINKVINKPWAPDGRNFSDRIWTNKAKLVNELNTTLTQNIMLGQDPQKAIDKISKSLNVSKGAVGRLVMTEQAAFGSAARQDCFKDLDVEKYEIVATLDNRTSEICQDMDGKVFKMSDWQVGITAPPFHVNCRTTTAPYFDDDFGQKSERAARDENGKTYEVPADMTYSEWKKKYVRDAMPDNIRNAYDNYKDSLGKNMPDISSFQEIWNDNKRHKLFTNYVKAIESDELTPLADFSLYESVNKEIDEKIIGLTTSNGVKIKDKSYHSIARIIGSVKQRRSGVGVQEIVDIINDSSSEILPIRKAKNGRSFKIRGNSSEISINPDTGLLVQVNPIRRKRNK